MSLNVLDNTVHGAKYVYQIGKDININNNVINICKKIKNNLKYIKQN